MLNFRRLLLLSFFTTFLSLCTPSTALATEGFRTDLQATFVVHPNGNTTVKKTFTIANEKSTVYLQRYGVEIGSENLQDIKVYNSTGPVPVNIVQTDHKTSLGIQFSDKTVGKDKTHQFILEYSDPDLATILGQSVDIHIPALGNATDIQNYHATIQVPAQFTQPTLLRPSTPSISSTPSFTTLEFPESQGKDGIWVRFGAEQNLLLNLTYSLENPSGGQGEAQLVLPSDSAFQTVTFFNISPPPTNIFTDQDGNWIANYTLTPDEQQQVQVSALIKTRTTPFTPRTDFPPVAAHTANNSTWPTNHQLLQRIKHNYPTVENIYDFVRTNIRFSPTATNPQSIEQLLATDATGGAEDFNNVFITLARANKIPTRRVRGAVINSHDTFRPTQQDQHSWVEYFDETNKTWKMVDPLWAHTSDGDYISLPDLNRVSLVRQGIHPDVPNLTGAGKLVEAELQLDQTSEQSPPELAIKMEVINSISNSLIGQRPTLKVKNLTGQAWYQLPANIDFLSGEKSQQLTLPDLLPYQTIEVPLDIFSPSLNSPNTIEATIHIQAHQETFQIRPASFIARYHLGPVDAVILGTATSLGALTSFTSYLFLKKRAMKHKKKQKKQAKG